MRFLDWRMSLLVAGLCLATTGATLAQAPAVADNAPYLRPGRLVALEGERRLNLVCMGRGAPAVVLESGAGDGTPSWRKVQADLARTTRVCAYDRAGYGFSDPSPRTADAENAVDDLHRLLAAAGLDEPVVLVGHSVGGLYAELFAARHPSRVAGLVLIDPTGLDDFRLVTTIITDDERTQQRASFLKRQASYGRCLEAARRGEPSVQLLPECAPSPTGEVELDEVLRRQRAQPKYWQAFQSEMANFFPADHPNGTDSVITRQVRTQPLTLGSKPLIILMTPGRVPPGDRGERLRAGSTAAAERLAGASSRGKLVKVASGHYVQKEHPELVINAVTEVIASIRGSESDQAAR